jgi:hypothetical protein
VELTAWMMTAWPAALVPQVEAPEMEMLPLLTSWMTPPTREVEERERTPEVMVLAAAEERSALPETETAPETEPDWKIKEPLMVTEPERAAEPEARVVDGEEGLSFKVITHNEGVDVDEVGGDGSAVVEDDVILSAGKLGGIPVGGSRPLVVVGITSPEESGSVSGSDEDQGNNSNDREGLHIFFFFV